MNELNYREESILKSTVKSFIHSATPVGSGRLVQESETGLHAASVRRIMAELEEKGYLVQPHTSAGRVPTTSGYRYFVNELMEKNELDQQIKAKIDQTIQKYSYRAESFSQDLSDVLAEISRQLGIVLRPRLEKILFERIQIVPSQNNKMMVLLFGKYDFMQSTLLSVSARLNKIKLKAILHKINNQLNGLPLETAQQTLNQIINNLYADAQNIRYFLAEASRRLFAIKRYEGYYLTGTRNILKQPEFSDVHRVSTLIDLLEDRDILTHFMESREKPPGIRITIGGEHAEERIKACTVITSTYHFGQVSGVVGVIGPTRMPYGTIIPLVDYTARAISKNFGIC